jgi:cell division protein FtsB
MKILAIVLTVAGAVLIYTGYKGKNLKEVIQVGG